ncbi:MAG TPA: nucleotide pyrophosphatase/phosphodiesterase family protein [Gemmataceae bacterium]|nr:nucleotide pyrophosphatase/phosphodiesterase family protein [Gemmataceae bacterium]
MQPLVLLNTVGLTQRMLPHAPRLSELAGRGWQRPLREVTPAVTCTAQASMLTGQTAEGHGIVGNGWFFRDTGEIRFWQQSNRLIEAEPLYVTARRRWPTFRCAKLFWWFNQGAAVDISVTPKPHYGADGNKAFDILTTPADLGPQHQAQLGKFPFQTFWGPMAGLPCTRWIAQCAAEVLRRERTDLTLVYLPHLDYDTQRFGPVACDLPRMVRELDDACAPLLDAAEAVGARVWVVNECAHVAVNRAVEPNRALRKAGLLTARSGPFGEQLDTFESRAFAVCDHQVAHVYVKDAADLENTKDTLAALPGVGRVLMGEDRGEVGLRHRRSGELVLLAKPDAWFAYPFWLDDKAAPDYARTVNIHAKPGYDPCELFFDPKLWWPKGRAMRRLLQKMLGFRTLFDVVPLDTALVKGSHGLAGGDRGPEDWPLLIGHGPPPATSEVPLAGVRDLVLAALEVASN